MILSLVLWAGFAHLDRTESSFSDRRFCGVSIFNAKKQDTKLKLTTLVTSILILTTACSSSKTLSSDAQEVKANVASNTSTLRFGFINSSNKAPIGPTGWAVHKGIVKPELQKLGITDVRMFGFANGPDLNEALVAGQVDIGIYGDTPALVAKASGIKTRLINQEQVGMNVWLVAKKNGPSSIAELKGQKVATSRGSYMHRYLIGLLQVSGIAQQVTVVHLLPRDAKAALERGDIAAFAAPISTGPMLVAQGFPVIDEAAKHPDLQGTSVTVVTEAFIKKHPGFPQQWNQIAARAQQEIKAYPQEYYKFHAQVSGYPIDVIKASYPVQQFPDQPFPTQGLKLLEGTKKFLVSQGLAKSDFKLADWIISEQL